MTNQTRRLLLRCYYVLPAVLWLLFLLATATRLGNYQMSWEIVVGTINFLAPVTPPISGKPEEPVSLYKLNEAFRNGTHIFLYAVLTYLVLRAIQQGETRLKRSSVLAVLGLSALFVAADQLIRARAPERHATPSDWLLSGLGVAIVLGICFVVYGIRDWAARTEKTLESESTD